MNDSVISPTQYPRRSFQYRKFDEPEITWSERNNYAVVSSITDPKEEINFANNLALSDLSYIQRIGFKGFGTCDWLIKNNIQIPANINTSFNDSNGCVIARLGSNDILILDNIKHETNVPSTLEDTWHQDFTQSTEACGFIMPRQESHACFSISGIFTPDMFSKLCAIDLRTNKFGNNMVAQTSLARISAIIIRNDLNALTNYLVLVESASAEYCWDCVLEAMQEFNGQIIGHSALAAFAPEV